MSDTTETDKEQSTVLRSGGRAGDIYRLARKFERERDAATRLAGELLAVIRVNHANDRFVVCSTEQLDEFLKPYDARLLEIGPLRTANPSTGSPIS